METNFIDYVKIICRSGKGGRGSMHMHRAKYVPNGGPDGGDGGRGGHVFLRGNRNFWTLLHLRYERHVFASHGGNGGKSGSHGADGEDRYIDVPCGTVVYDAETGRYICDVTTDGQVVQLLKGGRGGLGNKHFATSTNQAPRYAQPGEPMQELTIILELKMLADVGLVGFPNAGKSTLVNAISSAHPKIAGYPFTTLEPSVGVVSYRDNRSFVIADIPGIIEGASEGKGLGLRFLRHIERNALLLFMIPGDTEDIRHDYEVLLNELTTYNPELLDKQRVLAITKSDLLDEELMQMLETELPTDLPHIFISAVTGFNTTQLKDLLWLQLDTADRQQAHAAAIVHRDKDLNTLQEEIEEEERLSPYGPSPYGPSPLPLPIGRGVNTEQGEDQDLFIVDEEDLEDIEDFEDLKDIEDLDSQV